MNTKSHFSSQTWANSRWRFNPVTAAPDPATVTRYLDSFEAGCLRDAVLHWQQLEHRDDMLRTVISKRKKSVARHGYAVLPLPNLPPALAEEAREHAAALECFYDNLQSEHALDSSEKGGFKTLARQMMDAVGKQFAVHEIVWRVQPDREDDIIAAADRLPAILTARFRFVPLQFFENTTGELRFLPQENANEGQPLEPGAWMITTGDGLMKASSAAWARKQLALEDWLRYSQKNGRPVLRAKTASARNSDEWTAVETALQRVVDGSAAVFTSGDDIAAVDLLGHGTIPFPQLVERMDRLIASMWRGADLSTLSRDKGYGASLQEKESSLLEEDDAEMISETLNRYVDPWVIRFLFGKEVKPLARVKVLVSPKESTSNDLQIDEFLLRNGAPLSLSATLERYGRALPKTGEALLKMRSKAQSNEAAAPGSLFNGPAVALEEGAELRNAAEGAETFTILQKDWIQLSPYGEFRHTRGLQRVDRAAAENMVANFDSFLARLGRLFGGAPLYAGHPDMPGTSDSADRKAYGWITKLEAREDGLYGQVKWSAAGSELLKNAHYKFVSPYWQAEEIASENGRPIFRPTSLISVGLTNCPNLPVKPLANETRAVSEATNKPIRTRNLGNFESIAHVRCITENLAARKNETLALANRRERILNLVHAKTREGVSYDEAWARLRREEPGLFED